MSKKGFSTFNHFMVDYNGKNPVDSFIQAQDSLSQSHGIFSENDPNNKKKRQVAAGDGPFDSDVAERADSQFVTRGQDLQSKALAAGAQRSDNQADLLGYVTPAKRRSASRAILG